MFLAAMEEGAEERAQQLEEKRAKWEAEVEERRQERDKRHEERMQSQFFCHFPANDRQWVEPTVSIPDVSTIPDVSSQPPDTTH